MRKRITNDFLKVVGSVLIVCGLFMAVKGQENIQYSQGQVDEGFSNKLSVPLMNYKGRGIDLPISLNYSSNVWRIDNINTVNIGVFQTITQAIYAEHSTAGWKTSLDLPKIEWPKSDDIYNLAGRSCGPPVCTSGPLRIRRVTIHMPDGSSHELREDDTPHSGSVDVVGTFYAVDGSRMRYDSVSTTKGTLYMPDGTKYELGDTTTVSGDTISRIFDRNGNYLTFSANTKLWTDTLGRVIGLPFPANPQPTAYPYTLPGLSGVNGGSQTYVFQWKNLTDVLTPGSGDLRVIGSHYLPSPSSPPTGPSATPNNYPLQHGNVPSQTTYDYDSLFYSEDADGASTYTVVVGKGQPQNQIFNPVVLHEIFLPDGRSYKFTYNVYGEITKIIYPTGAFEEYQIAPLGGSYSLDAPYDQAERGIISRKLSENGTGNDFLQWTYSKAEVGTGSWGSGTQGAYRYRVVAPNTTCSETYRLKLHAPAHGGVNNYTFWDWDFVDPINGATVESRAYGESTTACSGSLLRRELTSYERTANPIGTPLPNSLQVYNYRNIRPARKTTILFENGSSSALAQTSTFTYDTTYEDTTGVDQTTTAVFDYVVMSDSTAPSATISGISTGNPLKSSVTSFSSDSAYRSANILGLPVSVEIRNGAGTPVSRSEMIYDETGYIPSGSHRALPTTSRVWDSTKNINPANSSAYLSTHATFDLYGNRTIATDAKGFETTTTYDTTYYAYPIYTTTEVPDPTSTHGTGFALTSSTTYDPATGLVLSSTDINGQVTTFEYNDPLLRLKKVTAPNGQQTVTIYGAGTSDATRKVTVQSQIDANQSTEVTSYYDRLGRTYLTQKNDVSDPDGDSYALTCYDTMGRVLKTSSPFRNYTSQNCSSSSLKWTVPEYDDLSRTKQVTMPVPSPAGTPGTVVTSYGISITTGAVGTTRTITDEAGKQRIGITDALGNMVRVIEDPNGLNYTTDYKFDTLGNLRQTVQGDQIRYFSYDSLGRILRAKQVEQDVNPALALPAADPITDHNSWSVRYTYDDNSNILTTTNARNQTVTATYDQLNRLIIRNYDDTTPDVDFYYDGKGIGSMMEPVNALGKTTKVSSSVSESKYVSFDTKGGVSASEQVTDNKTYSFSYTYNLAGALIEETYPSGRVVKNTINTDGELAQVQSKKNSTVGFFTYADAFRYNAAGAVTKMQLGNGHWETVAYNERQQVTQIGLGTVDNQQDLMKLDFGYTVGPTPVNTPDRNNGSMRSQTITVPAVGSTPGFTAVQTYTYDNLNRLETATETVSSTQSWKQEFSYDRYGNKSFVTGSGHTTTLGACVTAVCNPTFNSGSANDNRFALSQGGTYTYEYDAEGSLKKDATGQRFEYDAEGRQNAFFAANNGTSTPSLNYAFDGEGKRVKKFNGSTETVFVYDAGGKLTGEYEIGNNEAVPSVSYMTNDHLGSPRVVTDANGTVVSRKDFAAFGDETITSHRTATLGYNIPDIRQDYTGYLKDEESGLEFAVNRYYSSRHGRFTSVDLLPASASQTDPQTFNRYSYVSNDPLNAVDPSGLTTVYAGEKGNCGADLSFSQCGGGDGFWGGGGGFGDHVDYYNRDYAGMPQNMVEALGLHFERVNNSRAGDGFLTNAQVSGDEAAIETFPIHYDDYDESNPQSANPRFYEGAIFTIYEWMPRLDQITHTIRDAISPINDMAFPGHSRITNWMSQSLWGTNLIDTESQVYQEADTVTAIAGMVLPGPGGKYKAANALVKHQKLIKAVVLNASRTGVKLSPQKFAQLERVVTKAGGGLRTEIGMTGTVKGILHSHVTGFGPKIANRHILH